MSRSKATAPEPSGRGEPRIVIDVHTSRDERRSIEQRLSSAAATLGLGAGWGVRLSAALVYERPRLGTWSWRVLVRSPDGRKHQVVLTATQRSADALAPALAECSRVLNTGGRARAEAISPKPLGVDQRQQTAPPRKRQRQRG